MALWILLALAAYAAEPVSPKPQYPAGTYLNPAGDPPLHLAEPFIVPYAKKYFLFGTASPSEGFQCYESSDLAHWNLDGWAWRKVGLHVALGDLHSPQVFVYQNTFILVYSARMPTGAHLGLAASLKPQGPYHDLHVPWLDLEPGCVAGDVFVDRNGKAFLSYTRAGTRNGCHYRMVYGVALAKDLSKTNGKPVKLLETGEAGELAPNAFDQAGRVFRAGSKYYLVYSVTDPHSPGLAVGYASADNPLGPWSKGPTPLLRPRPEIGVMSLGHPAVFCSLNRNEWFIVYDSLTRPAGCVEAHVVNFDRIQLQENSRLAVRGPTRSPQPLP